MTKTVGAFVLALSITTLIACSGGGGGGGGDNQSPAPVNGAPSFVSPSELAVTEGSLSTGYTAAATDPDGDPLTFAIAGGADESLFTIGGTSGVLSFVTAPDFFLPTDQNIDNVYEVRLSVSDGNGGSASINVSITVVADPATGVRYRDPIFANVTETLNVKFGDGQLDGGGTQELFMDVYVPSGDSETNRAVMIIAHGGGFIGGNRQQETDTAISFARRGYVAATIDYRLIDGLPSDGDELSIGALKAVHDAFAAVRFFREDALGSNVYGTRPDAIFMGGVSAGGVIAAVAATFDDADTATSAALENFRTANGGTAGNSSSNLSISSEIQGAMPISGAILDVNWIDAQSKPQYAAHDEFDAVVPCRTGAEGSTNTGLIVIGPCDYIPAYDALSITADLLLKLGSTGHVSFTEGERELIYTNAGALFLSEVIDP